MSDTRRRIPCTCGRIVIIPLGEIGQSMLFHNSVICDPCFHGTAVPNDVLGVRARDAHIRRSAA